MKDFFPVSADGGDKKFWQWVKSADLSLTPVPEKIRKNLNYYRKN